MTGTPERIPFYVEINRIIDLLAKQIYQTPLALLRENCQNAYDAVLLRRHLLPSFQPAITIAVTPTQVQVTDNGIGMTKQELEKHYWRAGSSGKSSPEARAAGVVGTFGIGAMANFGVASKLTVITESATDGQRTRCNAVRETLSATEGCIDVIEESPTGKPGTTVIAEISPDTPVNVEEAKIYIAEFVKHVDVPVMVNDELVSQQSFEATVPKPPAAWEGSEAGVGLGPELEADIELVIAKTGEVWVGLRNLRHADLAIDGVVLLRQGRYEIQTFRSRFALAKQAISSSYKFGGVANLPLFEPTAGREALTTPSVQLLQAIVTECERYVSTCIAATDLSNSNTGFMDWAVKHERFDLCSNLMIRMEPDNQSTSLKEISERSKASEINYFEGSDQTIVDQYATEERPLIVVSTRQPRRKCELAYLSSYCRTKRIVDAPKVLEIKDERDWTIEESAFSLRTFSILESDYFVKARVDFGRISHGIALHVDTSKSPIQIVLDSSGPTLGMMLRLYREGEDSASFTGMVKDFVRSMIFPKIANLVPSSTRQGAEAFLRAIRGPREVFEYERSDLGSLSEIWEDYLKGKITMTEAARESTAVVRTTVQVVDHSAVTSASTVIPDVLENERILAQEQASGSSEELEALPAIVRLQTESPVKLLTIGDDETPLKGYRAFIAITDRVRERRGDFYLQPHRTEVVWGGQKVLYIFQHHSGQFALYYELQGTELLTDAPGGRAFPTCTIVLKNQIYIPIPDEIREKFIPPERGRKRFEVRCELLFPDLSANRLGARPQD